MTEQKVRKVKPQWSSFGKEIVLKTRGESHGPGYDIVLSGVPAGLRVNQTYVQAYLDQRKAWGEITTERKEPDRVEIISGIYRGRTTGEPIVMYVANTQARSSDYDLDVIRPGSMDWPLFHLLGYIPSGGGTASARETLGRVAGGAVTKRLLEEFGIYVVGFARKIGGVVDTTNLEKIDLEDTEVFADIYRKIYAHETRAINDRTDRQMKKRILDAIENKETVGGTIEVRAAGLPIGLGQPVFDKLSADMGKALLSIPAVKGVDIGTPGIEDLPGSVANDEIGRDRFYSNRGGGFLAGYSTGLQQLVTQAKLKGLSSVRKSRRTVDIHGNKVRYKIQEKARRDPCGVQRGVVVAEAMVALTLADHLMRRREDLKRSPERLRLRRMPYQFLQ